MADYISRKAVMELRPKNIEIIDSSAYIELDELLDLVGEIPAADVEPVRRWIPCSERLPETNGEDASYLVYMPSFGAVDIADYHPDVDEWTFMCLPVTVTHWQPLPEPPEEGDAGNGLD